jgi:uncharacterized protein YjbI with pentapeptide repeats
MLKRCSQNKDLSEWNDWRKANPEKDINLGGYNFEGFFLKKANFIKAKVYNKSTNVYINYTGEVHLEKATFKSADLENTRFGGAILKKAVFYYAEASKADFGGADLEEAKLGVANLQNCRFTDAILKDSHLISSHLEGAKFTNATLVGCQVRASVCDNATSFYGIKINKFSTKCYFTDFSATSFESARFKPGTRQLLEYNIRRMNWEDWYKQCKWYKPWQWPVRNIFVRTFWWMSDYGKSTLRIIGWFWGLAFAFAAIYYFVPGLVENLQVTGSRCLNIVRACYFSIVTMTTLGFGDIYANKTSIWGHVLLAMQVIIGYGLLGALITRLAVLFTGDGPAGEFAKDKKERNENPKSNAG